MPVDPNLKVVVFSGPANNPGEIDAIRTAFQGWFAIIANDAWDALPTARSCGQISGSLLNRPHCWSLWAGRPANQRDTMLVDPAYLSRRYALAQKTLHVPFCQDLPCAVAYFDLIVAASCSGRHLLVGPNWLSHG